LPNETFKALLNRIADGYPSRAALAKALHVTPSRLSRALNTGDFPLNVANCLRLAKVSGESATQILRAAGKSDIAELIESLYGADRTRLLTATERELLDDFEKLTPRAREALHTLLADLLGKRREKSKRTA
jgi:plasmid maintenance system antidote protein VapI